MQKGPRQKNEGFKVSVQEFCKKYELFIDFASFGTVDNGRLERILAYLRSAQVLECFLNALPGAGDSDVKFNAVDFINGSTYPVIAKRLQLLLSPENEPILVRFFPFVSEADILTDGFWENLEKLCSNFQSDKISPLVKRDVLDYMAIVTSFEVSFVCEYIASCVSQTLDSNDNSPAADILFDKEELLVVSGGALESPVIPFDKMYKRINYAFRSMRSDKSRRVLAKQVANYPQDRSIFLFHVIPEKEYSEIFIELISYLPDTILILSISELAGLARDLANMQDTRIQGYVKIMIDFRTDKDYVKLKERVKVANSS